jgi:hypothetical protein
MLCTAGTTEVANQPLQYHTWLQLTKHSHCWPHLRLSVEHYTYFNTFILFKVCFFRISFSFKSKYTLQMFHYLKDHERCYDLHNSVSERESAWW